MKNPTILVTGEIGKTGFVRANIDQLAANRPADGLGSQGVERQRFG